MRRLLTSYAKRVLTAGEVALAREIFGERTYAADPEAAYASLNIEQQATRWEQRYIESA